MHIVTKNTHDIESRYNFLKPKSVINTVNTVTKATKRITAAWSSMHISGKNHITAQSKQCLVGFYWHI